jgi:5-methylcytosine-specific restriction endonuclease McrA
MRFFERLGKRSNASLGVLVPDQTNLSNESPLVLIERLSILQGIRRRLVEDRNHWQDRALAAEALLAKVPERYRTGAKKKRQRRNEIDLGKRFKVFQRDGYRCQICGASAEQGVTLQVDHKVPVIKGGTNQLNNLWVLCFDCNQGKKARDL